MDVVGLFWKGKKEAEPQEVPEAVEEAAAPPPQLRTGGLRRPTTQHVAQSPFRRPAVAGLSKLDAEKLADLRKRVIGGTPTAYTHVLDAAQALAEAGITDQEKQLRGALKTSRVTSSELKDAIAGHKAALLTQREGFARVVTQKREEAAKRRAEIRTEAEQIQQRLLDLENEDGTLAAKEQEMAAAEAEFQIVADTLDAEITTTGDKLVSLAT